MLIHYFLLKLSSCPHLSGGARVSGSDGSSWGTRRHSARREGTATGFKVCAPSDFYCESIPTVEL